MTSPSSSQPRQPRRHSSSFKERAGRKMVTPRVRSRETMELPDHLKFDEDEEVDDGTGIGKEGNARAANQSVYGIIAAMQNQANFQALYPQDSGTESEGDDDDSTSKSKGHGRPSSQKHDRQKSSGHSPQEKLEVKTHGQKMSENSLARSFFRPTKGKGDIHGDDPMTQSQLLPPRGSQAEELKQPKSIRTNTPILDRKLQAMAKAQTKPSSASMTSKSKGEKDSGEETPKSLSTVVANMFNFEEPEEIISEYSCWYTQNVMLQGLFYITAKHACFYSYLQKKTNSVLKQGQIGKRSKHGYRYHRYWFVLKGDSFSYFKSSADPYFPLGGVDLRYAISAEISTPETGKDATDFTITTADRVYFYRADTSISAREWVKQLQKVIFRIHNEGDSVKLSLPLENILDVECTSVFDFSETVKLHVISGDDTYAVDDYFFTFFNFGKEAAELLQEKTAGNKAKASPDEDSLSPARTMQEASKNPSHSLRSLSGRAREPVRPSLSPLSAGRIASPRSSNEYDRLDTQASGASVDRDKAIVHGKNQSGSPVSRTRWSQSPRSSLMQESTESFVTSSENAASTSTLGDAINPDMSASVMLTDDGMFNRPTLRSAQVQRVGSSRAAERLRAETQESSRESSTERVRVQSSAGQPSEQRVDNRPHPQRQGSGGSGRTVGADEKKMSKPVDIKGPGRLVRGISMPLQHAMTVAEMVRSSGKRVGSILSSSPKTYMSNFSEAFAGGKRHYTDVGGISPDDSVRDTETDSEYAIHEQRMREHFKLPQTEKLLSTFYCWLHRTIPVYGKIYLTSSRFCFRSLLYGTNTKLVIPYQQVTNIHKQTGFRWGYPGMIAVIRGYEELFFDFYSFELRDDAVVTIIQKLDTGYEAAAQSTVLTEQESHAAAAAAAENELLREARKDGNADHDLQLPHGFDPLAPNVPPILLDDGTQSTPAIKPDKPLRIVCLTIGTRGDVQPFIALCKGLMADGHRCKIVTHAEFKPWIEKHGIDFAEVAGDPAELMRLCVEYGMFTPRFVVEAQSKCRKWLLELAHMALVACGDAELMIESPVAMVGIHIAEMLQIPYFRAFGMPYTRTRAYPQALVPLGSKKFGGDFNYTSYILYDYFMWAWQSFILNPWRGKDLGLPPTSSGKLQQDRIPFLYNFSPSVVFRPVDFNDWIHITGYWFLDEGENYEPPEELANFIKQARDDNKKIAYVGFGSVTVPDARALTQNIVDAVVKADVCCILSKGWSDRFEKENGAAPIELPDCIHQIRSAPHDWLFKQVDSAMHHGGCGTTGASLRAGLPTIIAPFFGDQFFWANRVEDLGVGHYMKDFSVNQISKMLWLGCNDDRLQVKAAALGKRIRAESGVETAIQALYSQMDYAESLIKQRRSKPGDGDVEEEDWTFIDEESLETDVAAAMMMDDDFGLAMKERIALEKQLRAASLKAET